MRSRGSQLLAGVLMSALMLTIMLAALVLALNTEQGRRMLANAINQASDGQIVITDLGGWIPLAPRLGALELRDRDGVWLRVQDAAMRLELGALTRGTLAVTSLTARSAGLARLPRRDADGASAFSLPLPVELRRLTVEQLDLGQVVQGAPRLTIDGSARYLGAGAAAASVLLTAADRVDHYRLNLVILDGKIGLDLAAREGPGGLLSALAESQDLRLPPSIFDWQLDATAVGPRTALALQASLSAGPLKAALDGVVDLESPRAMQLRLSANAAELDLTAAGGDPVGWQRLVIDADLSGPLASLKGSAGIEIDGLYVGDLSLGARLQLAGLLTQRPSLSAQGQIELTRAPEPLAALLGPAAQVSLLVRQDPTGWRIDAGTIEAPGVRAGVHGRLGADALDLDWTFGLPDINTLAADWAGRVDAQGTLTGGPRAAQVSGELSARLSVGMGSDAGSSAAGTGQTARRIEGQIAGRLSARVGGQTDAPRGRIDLTGTWDGQPVSVNLQAGRAADAGWVVTLGDSRWASVSAAGRLRLRAGERLPEAELRLRVEHLADLAPLVASLARPGLDPTLTASLQGRLDLRLTLTDQAVALLELEGETLSLPGSIEADALSLTARITELAGVADTTAALQLRGLSRGDIAGDLSLTAAGPAAALKLDADAELTTGLGPASVTAAGRLDVAARRLMINRLAGTMAEQTLRLLQPATLELADGVAVDRLRLGLGPGTLALNGRLSPRLDLAATVADLPLEPLWGLVADLAPDLAGDLTLRGTLNGETRLSGTLSAPLGNLNAEASGVRLTAGPGRALPPAKLQLAARLNATDTEIDARADAGATSSLRLRGRLGGPLTAPGALALRANGSLDLTLLNPLLNAAGRQTSGQLLLDADVGGSFRSPRLNGRLRITDAALSDLRLGINLSDVGGALILSGDDLLIERLTGRAGNGTVALTGRVGVLAPDLPVDLRLVAEQADLVQLDRLDINADANVRLQGLAGEQLTSSGRLRFSRIDIRLPERLPPNIVTLQVRERGTPRRPRAPASTPAWRPRLLFDLLLSAPRAIRVRGRGVDAELGGEVRLRGSLQDPDVGGGFDLVRGEYMLVGQHLRFSRGRIAFEGAAGLEPTLDLEARVTAAGGTAILAVLGTAGAPRIELRGEPEMPQDEVLSRLLFGTASGRLSPWQIARIGLAATSLAGVNSGGPGLLERVRGGLGLGRLSIGEDQRGDATLEAGRRLSERVYLGARQGMRAGETQGVLRLDATPRIRLETDIGASGGARAGAAFELEY
jgi:translocation and assembly module TamB